MAASQQPTHTDYTFHASEDDFRKPLLEGYCQYVRDVKSAVLETWSRYLGGEITVANAALVAKFGLHLIEIRTNEVVTGTQLESSPTKSVGGNVFWRAIQKLHEEAIALIQNSEQDEYQDIVLKAKEQDARYIMPVLSTLLQYQTGKSDDMTTQSWSEDLPMPQYGDDLVRSLRGGLIKLIEGYPINEAKYDTAWKIKCTIFHLRMIKLLGRSRTDNYPPFVVHDILTKPTNVRRVDALPTTLPTHYPACLDLLLDMTKASMLAGRNPVDDLLSLATTQKNDLEDRQSTNQSLAASHVTALGWAKTIINDSPRLAYERLHPGQTMPHRLHLTANPILAGIHEFMLLALDRSAARECEANSPTTLTALHLYNMARQMGGMDAEDPAWEDAEYAIEDLGCQRVFGRATRPTTWSEIDEAFDRAVADETMLDGCLDGSELMDALVGHVTAGDEESLGRVREFVLKYLEEQQAEMKERGGTCAEKDHMGKKDHDTVTSTFPPLHPRNTPPALLLHTLSSLIAAADRGWYFSYSRFRNSTCMPMLAFAKDALFHVFPKQMRMQPRVGLEVYVAAFMEQMRMGGRRRVRLVAYLAARVGMLGRGVGVEE